MENKSDRSFIIASFYTKNTLYEHEIRKLKKSCIKHNIPFDFFPVNDQGTWEKNCALKPKIIATAMDKWHREGKNIVYLDADARIMRYPVLFDNFDADFGAHYLAGQELLSGTLFFRNCQKCYHLVYLWHELLRESKWPVWDQVVLQHCIREYGVKLELKVKNLPPTYTQIFDTMEGTGKPIIKHMQASRRAKANASSI